MAQAEWPAVSQKRRRPRKAGQEAARVTGQGAVSSTLEALENGVSAIEMSGPRKRWERVKVVRIQNDNWNVCPTVSLVDSSCVHPYKML